MNIIVNPVFIFNFVTIIQMVFWMWCMPENGGLMNIAPKINSETSLIRFIFLYISGNLGFLTYFVYDSLHYKRRSQTLLKKSPWLNIKIVFSICILIVVADLFYLRSTFINFSSVLETILETGRNYAISHQANKDIIWGITTFNNLIPISVIFLWLTCRNDGKPRKVFYIWIMYLILMVALSSRRLIFAYAMLSLLPLYFAENTLSPLKSFFSIIVTISFLFILTIILEFFRLGPIIAKAYSIENLWSIQGFLTVSIHWLKAYTATDFNNMLVILKSPPSMQIVSTAPSFINILNNFLQFFGQKLSFIHYGNLPEWKSGYGTVNLLGLLWYDFGYFSIFVTFLYTSTFSLLYSCYKSSIRVKRIDFAVVSYALFYPGLFGISRLNYLLSVQFLICFGFVILVSGSYQLIKWCRRNNAIDSNTKLYSN